MKRFAECLAVMLCLGCLTLSGQTNFTSFYMFGDGACTTTGNPDPDPPAFYYGKRFCNGRVWVEVLSQRQGITYAASNNSSFFGQTSFFMMTNVINGFPAPADAATSLFGIWVIDADFVGNLNDNSFFPLAQSNIAIWTNAINHSITNYIRAITNLYSKGMRTLIAPTGVDITKAPNYSALSASEKSFVRARMIDFNNGFTAMLAQQMPSMSDLVVIVPDLLSLLDTMVANPRFYGFTNSISDAVDDGFVNFTNRGTNYVWWDYLNPSAKVQEIVADTTQGMLSPAQMNKPVLVGSSNRIDIVNIPLGLGGYLDSTADMVHWTLALQFVDGSTASQSLFVPTNSVPMLLYRLRFPFSWTFP